MVWALANRFFMYASKTLLGLGLGLVLAVSLTAPSVQACTDEVPATDPVSEPVAEPTPASAAQLNEVWPAPSTGEEFIEIQVLDSGGGSLHGWSVRDASQKTFTFDAGEMDTMANPYFVLTSDVSKLALNNDGDSVELLNPAGEVIDSVTYEKAEKDISWSRLSTGWVWTTGTPGAVNASPDNSANDSGDNADDDTTGGDSSEDNAETPQQIVSNLKFNELLPNPTGDESTDEWIELLNNDAAGSISGWSITDGTKTYTLPDTWLERDAYAVISIQDSKINLNNTGDTLYLIDPQGQIAQGVEYTAAPSGESFSRFGDSWEWTSTLTPGEVNQANAATPDDQTDTGSTTDSAGSSQDATSADSTDDPVDSSDTQSTSLAEVRSLEKGTAVTVEGVVSVEAGPLGSQVIYIQDDTGGMQIYSYHKDFPTDLVRGSLISVTGVTSTSYSEARVNANEGGISVLEQQDEVSPKAVQTLESSDIGVLVIVEGIVNEKTSTRLYLDTGMEVYAKSSTDISLSGFAVGNHVRVTGIVNQYNDTLRLEPRQQDDLELVQESGSTVSTASAATLNTNSSQPEVPVSVSTSTNRSAPAGWIILALSGVILAAGLLRQWWKQKEVVKRFFAPYTGSHEIKGRSDSGHHLASKLRSGPGA